MKSKFKIFVALLMGVAIMCLPLHAEGFFTNVWAKIAAAKEYVQGAFTLQSTKDAALNSAALIGDLEGAQEALKRGADINSKGKFGKTALHMAVSFRHHDMVAFLVERGADVHEIDNNLRPPIFDVINGRIDSNDRKIMKQLVLGGTHPATLSSAICELCDVHIDTARAKSEFFMYRNYRDDKFFEARKDAEETFGILFDGGGVPCDSLLHRTCKIGRGVYEKWCIHNRAQYAKIGDPMLNAEAEFRWPSANFDETVYGRSRR